MIEITQKLLTPNPYSRPQTPLHRVKGLIMHWVGNPWTTALFNRNFFEGLKNQDPTSKKKKKYASAHLIVGLDGEILQCVPLDEIAHHAGPTPQTTKEAKRIFGDYPNGCLIGIETCHLDWDGRYTDKTWHSAVKLCAWLCQEFGLTEDDIFTHHYITGKGCPRWFVRNPDEWVRFINDVEMVR